MTQHAWLLLAANLAVLLATVKPVGLYLAKLIDGAPGWQPLARCKTGVFRLCGISQQEMNWRQYALAILLFSVAGVFVVYALQRWQAVLPLNPQQFGNITPDSSFNTAINFVTNTNWQGYGGEAT